MSQSKQGYSIFKYVVIYAFTSTAVLYAHAADQVPDANGPVMDAASNGVPIVHILPPSEKGVSHNTYQQFNIGNQGVILNNALGATQTQLGGTVSGNIFGNAPARIILNEVTSATPSTLLGIAEIAGVQAEFILANPNGITCNGCGFINTSRASLVTGSPLFNGLDLTGFNINSGNIVIGEGGLNALSVNELDLLSRSLVINGNVEGKNVYAITGANRVDYATLDTTPLDANNEKPTVAIDIAQLGGMHANRIYMLATEEGVGVNNRGYLESNGGGFSLDANGKLTNSGLIHSNSGIETGNGSVTVTANDIENNQGTVYADSLALMQAVNNIDNETSVIEAQNVRLTAGNTLSNISTSIAATGDVALASGADLNITAGSIEADGDISLLSGQDLDINPLVDIDSNTVYGTRTQYVVNTAGGWSRTGLASVTCGAGGPLTGQYYQVTSFGSITHNCTGPQMIAVEVPDGSYTTTTNVANAGSLIDAGNDVILLADSGDISMDAVSVNAGNSIRVQSQAVALFGSKDSVRRSSYKPIGGGFIRTKRYDETLVRGGLNAVGDISVMANGDETLIGEEADHQGNIFFTGSNVNSDTGHVAILGTGNVDIANDVTRHTKFYEYYEKKKSLFKKKTTHIISSTTSGVIEPALVSANSISVGADGDLNIIASDLIADNSVGLYAGKDLNLLSEEEIYHAYNYRKVKKSGVFSSGGLGITIGSKSYTERSTNDQLKQITSSVSSLNGDVYATAGNQYLQLSSEIITPQGDINIQAKEVAINSKNNSQSLMQSIKTRQTGLTIGVSSPLVTAVQSVANIEEAKRRTEDPRMQGLAMLTQGLTSYNLFTDIQKYAQNPTSSISGAARLELSFGTSKTSYESLTKTTVPEESVLVSGGDINIQAHGDDIDEQGDISMIGTLASADGNVNIKANNNVYLAAAVGKTTSTTKSKSSSASIGISIGADGFNVNLGATNSRGFSNGWGTTYFPTELTAKQALTIESGKDTTLKGATVSGDSIVANIGTKGQGDLFIKSPQDSSHFIAKETSSGFSISIPITGAGVPSLGLSASDLELLYNYQSAKQQTAFRAGEGGFNINVNGHTQLDGGAIASLADASQNSLVTQTLDFTNLTNYENADGFARSITLNLSADPNKIYNGSGVGLADIAQSSYGRTLAAIAPANITITRPNQQLEIDKKHASDIRTRTTSYQEQKTTAEQNIYTLEADESVSGSIAYWKKRVATLSAQVGPRPTPPTTTQCSMLGCQTVVVTSGLQYIAYLNQLAIYNSQYSKVTDAQASLAAAETSLVNSVEQLEKANIRLAELEAAQAGVQNPLPDEPDSGATVAAISRDPNTAHKPVNPIFDTTKATAELNAGVSITMAFGKAAYKTAGDFAQQKLKEAIQKRADALAIDTTVGTWKEKRDKRTEQERLFAEAESLENTWKEGGIGRITLHAIIGGLQFGTDGAVAATANQVAQTLADELLAKAGISDSIAVNTIKFATATAVGAGVGGAEGAATTIAADANNRQLHAGHIKKIRELANGDSDRLARLYAAGCYIEKCSEEHAEGSADYIFYKKLEESGAFFTEEVAELEALYIDVPLDQLGYRTRKLFLFERDLADIVHDSTLSTVREYPRTVAAGNTIIGALGTIGLGAATVVDSPLCSTGFGCVVTVATAAGTLISLDYTIAEGRYAFTGVRESTLGETLLTRVGFDEQEASAIYAVTGIATGSAASIAQLGKVFKSAKLLDPVLDYSGNKILRMQANNTYDFVVDVNNTITGTNLEKTAQRFISDELGSDLIGFFETKIGTSNQGIDLGYAKLINGEPKLVIGEAKASTSQLTALGANRESTLQRNLNTLKESIKSSTELNDSVKIKLLNQIDSRTYEVELYTDVQTAAKTALKYTDIVAARNNGNLNRVIQFERIN